MTKICYESSTYRWSSMILLTLCAIAITVLLMMDILTKSCNDQYHDISACLDSDTCEEVYCEPTPCSNYTCLPRLKGKCIYGDIYYYPDDVCPKKKLYRTSYIVLIIFGVICIIIATYLITMCHYRYAYHPYKELETSENL